VVKPSCSRRVDHRQVGQLTAQLTACPAAAAAADSLYRDVMTKMKTFFAHLCLQLLYGKPAPQCHSMKILLLSILSVAQILVAISKCTQCLIKLTPVKNLL